ncbi:hypothetical protein [Enterococcus sp. AZ192]|uniref:hypothetical protein n=1 Tax=unclassified Enterococcus TaxID=2608891 RepID=UPI003D284B5F
MKRKSIGILAVSVSIVLLGLTFVFSKNISQSKGMDKVLTSEEKLNINSEVDSSTISSTVEEESIVDFKGMNGEQIYNIFKGHTAKETVDLLDEFNEDSDRIVVTSLGEVLKGVIDFKTENSNIRKIDTTTDPHGITVHELKALIEAHKEEINALANKQSQ